MEVWKDIKGYEGLYRISNTGKMLSLRYMGGNQAKELKTKKQKKKGYLWISLRNNGKEGHFLIHRLVAEAFIDNPNNYPLVNHKDENPQNNNVSNLEWCTRSYNAHYSIDRHPKRIYSRSIFKKVIQYSLDGKFICEYNGSLEVERKHGYNASNIRRCCNHTRKTAYGYKWEYEL